MTKNIDNIINTEFSRVGRGLCITVAGAGGLILGNYLFNHNYDTNSSMLTHLQGIACYASLLGGTYGVINGTLKVRNAVNKAFDYWKKEF